jgi:hypothetical protein
MLSWLCVSMANCTNSLLLFHSTNEKCAEFLFVVCSQVDLKPSDRPDPLSLLMTGRDSEESKHQSSGCTEAQVL